MRLHNCFVICCSDFCKLYPRGMLSLGMWYKPGVQDAARGPQRSTLGSFTTTTKVCETYPPPISLAPVYLILFVPSYLFPPSQFTAPRKEEQSGWIAQDKRTAGTSVPRSPFNRPQEIPFSRVITGKVLLSHP